MSLTMAEIRTREQHARSRRPGDAGRDPRWVAESIVAHATRLDDLTQNWNEFVDREPRVRACLGYHKADIGALQEYTTDLKDYVVRVERRVDRLTRLLALVLDDERVYDLILDPLADTCPDDCQPGTGCAWCEANPGAICDVCEVTA